MLKLLLFMTFCVQLGCSSLSRHQGSGYDKNSTRILVERNSNTNEVPNTAIFGTASAQSSASAQSADPIEQKYRMKNLENTLRSKKDLEQYSKVVPYFKTDDERKQFLQMPDYEARQQWLSNEKFADRSKAINEKMQSLVETQDIAVGMPQPLVKKAWGEPEAIEVAGNPQLRNERWKYSRYVSSQYGYKTEKKFVYFEAGKVVGLETE